MNIFEVISSLSTLGYLILTIFLLSENIRLRKAQTDPELVLFIQPEERFPTFLDIVVKNLGTGAAYNVTWKFDKSSRLASDENFGIGKLKFFEGLQYFAPGQEFRSFFASDKELFSGPNPPAMNIQVEYKTRDGKRNSREFIIDPQVFYGRSWIGNQPDMTESLRNIQRDISYLASGFKRLRVDVYDKQDRINEKKELEKHRASLVSKGLPIKRKSKKP